MYFLLNLSHYLKSYEHFCEILGLFVMLTHQIWSFLVTHVLTLENFLFCPNSAFNSHRISSRNSSTSEVISQKPHMGWETPPQ